MNVLKCNDRETQPMARALYALRSEIKSESWVELQREVFYFRDDVPERGRPVSEFYRCNYK